MHISQIYISSLQDKSVNLHPDLNMNPNLPLHAVPKYWQLIWKMLPNCPKIIMFNQPRIIMIDQRTDQINYWEGVEPLWMVWILPCQWCHVSRVQLVFILSLTTFPIQKIQPQLFFLGHPVLRNSERSKKWHYLQYLTLSGYVSYIRL